MSWAAQETNSAEVDFLYCSLYSFAIPIHIAGAVIRLSTIFRNVDATFPKKAKEISSQVGTGVAVNIIKG